MRKAVFLHIILYLVIAAAWIMGRRKAIRQIMQQNPGMTKAEAAASSGVLRILVYDGWRRKTEELMAAGLIGVRDRTQKPSKQYLLSLNETGMLLYLFEQQRMEMLMAGKPVDFGPGDISLQRDEIKEVSLFLKKMFGVKQLYLKIQSDRGNFEYAVMGFAKVSQLEAFFRTHSDIPVGNQVQTDWDPVVQREDPCSNIIALSPEAASKMRVYRRINMLMTVVSFISMIIVIFSLNNPVIAALVMACPLATTFHYIMHQEYVSFGGINKGVPLVFYAYLFNPGVTALICCVCIIALDLSYFLYFTFLIGLLCGYFFFFYIQLKVGEVKEHMVIKLGIIVTAVIFGIQVTALLSFIMIKVITLFFPPA